MNVVEPHERLTDASRSDAPSRPLVHSMDRIVDLEDKVMARLRR